MPSKKAEPRTEILHVRLTEAERRLLRAAAREGVDTESEWARRAIVQALKDWEARRPTPRRR